MRMVTSLRISFQTDLVAFCFDHPVLFRRQIFPNYKAHLGRNGDNPEISQEKERVRRVIDNVWKQLRSAGFINTFRSSGMESDDLMAKITYTYSGPREDLRSGPFIVLESSDKDLYQCLSERVILHGSSGTMTSESFFKTYRIPCRAWARMKAIAGCKTDGVPGIPGIGETTALKYIRGEMRSGSKYNKIRSTSGQKIIRRNRELVELPLTLCPEVRLDDRDWSEKKWEDLADRLRIKKERR